MSAPFVGEWCSITSANTLKNAVWFYSVLTYDQLVAQLQEQTENAFPHEHISLQQTEIALTDAIEKVMLKNKDQPCRIENDTLFLNMWRGKKLIQFGV